VDDGPRVGVVEHVPHLVGDIPVVHVDRHRTELQRREERLEVLGSVRAHDRDLVADAHTALGQMRRESRGAVVELAPRDAAVATHERLAVGHLTGDAAPYGAEVPPLHDVGG
jgi:hypothetical protein